MIFFLCFYLKIFIFSVYELQQRAPTPKRVVCPFVIRTRPSYYGREFHGIMSRDEAEQILLEEDGVDGRYLIRESARQKSQMTLSLRFNGQTKNFRLYHQVGKHYVNDMKRFDTVHDLVADGLITLYVELHGADYIANLTTECRYEESPYMTLHKDRLMMRYEQQNKNSNQQKSMSGNKSNRRSFVDSSNNCQILPISQEELVKQKDTLKTNNTAAHPQDSVTELEKRFDIKLLEKVHNFKTHTFIGHPWCDFCGNFIWGLIGQGVRCEGNTVEHKLNTNFNIIFDTDCGFGAHRKCSELVPNDCW